MAMGAIQVTGANLGIAITGIAGPSGGNRLKPVGTVFLAVISDQTVLGDRLRIPPINRAYIRLVSVGRAAALALEALDENR
jgi:nicotinamide-nucleotide amidase